VFDRTAGEGITVLDKDFWRPELMNPWTANNYRNGNYSWHVLSAFLKSRLKRLPRGWTPDILRINLAAKLFPAKEKPSANYRKAKKRRTRRNWPASN
jgi:type VI secretion system protein VasG